MGCFPEVEICVYEIINYFFGETITVSGLITAQDLISQLSGKDLGEELFISKSMIMEAEQIFLDDAHTDDVSRALNVKITPTANDGFEYVDNLLGIKY